MQFVPAFRLRLLRWSLAALACCGLALCFVLAAMQGPAAATVSRRLCSAGASWSCADVLASRWSRVAGVSVTLWGMAYFGFLVAWYAAVGLPNRAGRAWHVLPTLITSGGLLGSAWLTWVMLARLPTLCPWCLAVHGVNLLLFAATWLAWAGLGGTPLPPVHPTAARVRRVVAGSLAAITAFGALAYAQYERAGSLAWRRAWLSSVNDVDYVVWRHSQSPRHDLDVAPDDLLLGSADAPHTLVLFGDFQCAVCRQAHAFAKALAREFPRQLRLAFKHYPLDAACNSAIRGDAPGQHVFACAAARAFLAVRSAAGGEAAARFADLLYDSADQLAERPYERLAVEVGVDARALGDGMRDPRVDQRLADDVKVAARIGVTGAGELYLDGRRLPAWRIVRADNPSATDAARTRELWSRLLD